MESSLLDRAAMRCNRNKKYEASTSSGYTVEYWFWESRGDRNSIAFEVRNGRPPDAVTQENVDKIREKVLVDLWLSEGRRIPEMASIDNITGE